MTLGIELRNDDRDLSRIPATPVVLHRLPTLLDHLIWNELPSPDTDTSVSLVERFLVLLDSVIL